MSQFCGYTLQIELNDSSSTVLNGTITDIQNKDLVLSSVTYANGVEHKDKDMLIKGSDIKDLKVLALPPRKKKEKKKNKQDKENENGVTRSGTPTATGKLKNKKEKPKASQDPNLPYNYRSNEIDWQHENPGRLKEMEVFDFASNLQKFDKQSVFRELSKLDKVDPTNRLVGHNRTNEKVNYDNTEMVLDNKEKDEWDHIISNSAREHKISGSQEIESRTYSGNSEIVHQRKSATPVLGSSIKLFSKDREPVPTCSPIQLADVLQLSSDNFGLTDRQLTSDTGKSLAELIIKEITGDFRLSKMNHNSPPLMLILAGNNITGARALSAGRQLFNHGIRILVYVLHDFEHSEDEILPLVKENLDILTNIGGKLVSDTRELNSVLEKLDSPLELIIDGLQGYDTNLSDLLEPEVDRSKEIVEWCNKCNVSILSLDIPSGLDASSGTADFDSHIFCNYLVSVGIPLSSILSLYRFGYFTREELKHFVVDCGIPKKVFTLKSNLRKLDRYWFTTDWYASLEVE
ncbi:hypothetical protein KL930_001104 [Ogataea haglerorum]|uniref:Enhancer of mRNA-decapping protein 3 n=1 Tax=Ogataea haglerorum TaxID=1937702 RepID=A0AAN6DAE7_9ASCO|nr:hypothetical protein KL915_001105 [Ogataea haglerorum]KAG7712660.1 hypothetical protein KL950_000531 [Ogataea haglerorum]KAG7722710.1 hypothetical protein KL913_000530 [Ogataea haglerorum]KAG7723188.1 hypothetical protein KL949_000238 [Ogataea haglerorum]KAG7730441.1 hypothetical protein KL933_000236 [Ogataea haglerorum]